jgi:hypothetical protein
VGKCGLYGLQRLSPIVTMMTTMTIFSFLPIISLSNDCDDYAESPVMPGFPFTLIGRL